MAPLQPSNCGFEVGRAGNAGERGWTAFFRERFAGQPFKSVAIHFTDSLGQHFERKGEFVATELGIEGSLVYAVSALLRDEIARSGHATLTLDLLPERSAEQVLAEVAHPRGSRSLTSHLKSRLRIDGIKSALLHEVLDHAAMSDPKRLAAALKPVLCWRNDRLGSAHRRLPADGLSGQRLGGRAGHVATTVYPKSRLSKRVYPLPVRRKRECPRLARRGTEQQETGCRTRGGRPPGCLQTIPRLGLQAAPCDTDSG